MQILLIFMMLLFSSVLTGCMTVQPSMSLYPSGPFDDGPMIIRKIQANSPATNQINIGDKIVRLDDTSIKSIGQYFNLISRKKYQTVTLERPNSPLITTSVDNLLDPNSYQSYASPLADGESFVVRQTHAEGEQRLAGLVSAGPLFGSISGSYWDRDYLIIEVKIAANVSNNCGECLLKNVALMDWNAKSWIQPISFEKAAWIIYPALNQPGQMVQVPSPVQVGATAFSNTTGSFNAYAYDNYIYGTYSGNTVTSIVPQYDYTLTNVALAQNLGVAIQRDKINQQNKLRQEFVSKRSGNLRIGRLNPGEKISGYLFFAAPKNLTGPYVVFIDGGNRESVGAVKLSPTN